MLFRVLGMGVENERVGEHAYDLPLLTSPAHVEHL